MTSTKQASSPLIVLCHWCQERLTGPGCLARDGRSQYVVCSPACRIALQAARVTAMQDVLDTLRALMVEAATAKPIRALTVATEQLWEHTGPRPAYGVSPLRTLYVHWIAAQDPRFAYSAADAEITSSMLDQLFEAQRTLHLDDFRPRRPYTDKITFPE